MAPMSLLVLSLILSSLHPLNAQVITDSSSFTPLDLPINSSPQPTKQTVRFWPSLPPRGRSDVPIRIIYQDRLTTANSVQQEQRVTGPTAQSPPSSVSALSTRNLRSGPLTQPTVFRSRTDTASLALIRALAKGDATIKGSTPPLPTLPSTAVAEPADGKPVIAANSEEGSVELTEGDDLRLESSSTPIVMLEKESPVPLPTVGEEMAQYQPQAQTAVSEGLSSELSDVKTPKVVGTTVKPQLLTLTTTSRVSTTLQTETRATLSPVVTQATPRTVILTGKKINMLE